MSMEYVRKTYGVPAKRGMLVRHRPVPAWSTLPVAYGRIMSASNYVFVRVDGGWSHSVGFHPHDLSYLNDDWSHSVGFHPHDLVYLSDEGDVLWPEEGKP